MMHHPLQHVDLHRHLLTEFARERLLVGLPRLDGPPPEFPTKGQRRGGEPLGNQVVTVVAHEHRPHHPDLTSLHIDSLRLATMAKMRSLKQARTPHVGGSY